VVLIYALANLVALLLVGGIARPAASAASAAVVVVAIIGAGWISQTARDARAWDEAWGIQQQVLGLIASVGPRTDAQFFVFGAPRSTTPEVPVFIWPHDLGSAIGVTLRDERAWGAPIYDTTGVTCDREGPTAAGPWIPVTEAAYDAVYFVDVTRSTVSLIPDRATCRRILPTLRPGPITLPGAA
jgi:hypothetical protein